MLGSATPSLESLERVQAGRATLLELPARTAGAKPPSIHLIDLRKHGATQGIATPTVLAIQRHLDAGGQVLLYLKPSRLRADAVSARRAAGPPRARAAMRA